MAWFSKIQAAIYIKIKSCKEISKVDEEIGCEYELSKVSKKLVAKMKWINCKWLLKAIKKYGAGWMDGKA